VGRVEGLELQGHEAGFRFMKRCSPSGEGSTVRVTGVAGEEGGWRRPQSHVDSASHSQNGGLSLEGGCEPQVEPPGAQGKGELGEHRVRLHGIERKVLYQGEGGVEHLPFCGGDGERAMTTG
jgi:hypothetical protein